MITNFRTVLGLLLILGGILLALQQFGLIGGDFGDAVFTGLYVLGAYYFYGMYRQNRSAWWFGFLALLLTGLTIANLLNIFVPTVGEIVGGGIFLGMIGLGFLIAYFRDRTSWWAIIPAGVMLSLAAVSIIDDLPITLDFESGGILFLGMGITFLILSFMRSGSERLSWAIFPAVVLIVFGLFVGFGQAAAWGYIWPALIILFGLYFLISSLRR